MERITEETLLDHLVDFARNVRFEDLSDEVVREAKRRLIDATGCALGAWNDPAVRNVTCRLLQPGSDSHTGYVLGRGALFHPAEAAYANTHMIRVLDWNDTYLSLEPAHPSDNIGALLAVSGMREISGKDFLAAMVVTYDIQCRLCDAASLRARGWDHTYYVQLASTFGAAKLLGLSANEMKTAVSLAMRKVPLRQIRAGSQLSMAKGTAAAEAAREAMWSVLLAREGMTGPSEMVEGRFGMITQVTGPLRLEAFEGLGTSFKLPETYLKRYPVEYHAQAVVEAALLLKKEIEDPERIEEIEIVSYEAARSIIADQEKRRPQTKESADHSLYYILAVTLLDGEMTLRQFAPERFTDPAVLSLIDKMRDVRESAEYNEAYARREFPVSVRVRVGGKGSGRGMKRVRTYWAECALPKGHSQNPLTDEELLQKTREAMGTALPSMYQGEDLERLLSNVRAMDEYANARDAFEFVSSEGECDYDEE